MNCGYNVMLPYFTTRIEGFSDSVHALFASPKHLRTSTWQRTPYFLSPQISIYLSLSNRCLSHILIGTDCKWTKLTCHVNLFFTKRSHYILEGISLYSYKLAIAIASHCKGVKAEGRNHFYMG